MNHGIYTVIGAVSRHARNKLLSHKDIDTIISGKTLGAFDQGNDDAYFKNLETFASEVHNYVVGTPFSFDTLARDDAINVMETYSKGLRKQ